MVSGMARLIGRFQRSTIDAIGHDGYATGFQKRGGQVVLSSHLDSMPFIVDEGIPHWSVDAGETARKAGGDQRFEQYLYDSPPGYH